MNEPWRGYIWPKGWERPVYAERVSKESIALFRDEAACLEMERLIRRAMNEAVFAALRKEAT